jgi:hypothetical protein
MTTSMLEEDDLGLALSRMLASKGIQRLVLLYYLLEMLQHCNYSTS